jgi:hypothetical protein
VKDYNCNKKQQMGEKISCCTRKRKDESTAVMPRCLKLSTRGVKLNPQTVPGTPDEFLAGTSKLPRDLCRQPTNQALSRPMRSQLQTPFHKMSSLRPQQLSPIREPRTGLGLLPPVAFGNNLSPGPPDAGPTGNDNPSVNRRRPSCGSLQDVPVIAIPPGVVTRNMKKDRESLFVKRLERIGTLHNGTNGDAHLEPRLPQEARRDPVASRDPLRLQERLTVDLTKRTEDGHQLELDRGGHRDVEPPGQDSNEDTPTPMSQVPTITINTEVGQTRTLNDNTREAGKGETGQPILTKRSYTIARMDTNGPQPRPSIPQELDAHLRASNAGPDSDAVHLEKSITMRRRSAQGARDR